MWLVADPCYSGQRVQIPAARPNTSETYGHVKSQRRWPGVQIPWRRKLHAEISPALSDLEAFFNGDEKHPDRGLARAAALDLRNESSPGG